MAHWTQTAREYCFFDVASAMQKAIRRGDVKMASYWAMELAESRFKKFLWNRLLVITAEDCQGILTQEVESLRRCYDEAPHLIFIAKAVILVCEARKCRDADHLAALTYVQKFPGDEAILKDLEEGRKEALPIPDYAFDCHTGTGRSKGKTKRDFFVDEFDALEPRVPGYTDDDIEALRQDVKKIDAALFKKFK